MVERRDKYTAIHRGENEGATFSTATGYMRPEVMYESKHPIDDLDSDICRPKVAHGLAKITIEEHRSHLVEHTSLSTITMQSKPFPTHTSTLVIGGGPAGIVSLKYVQEYGRKFGLQGDGDGEDPVLVEMEAEIGGTFK